MPAPSYRSRRRGNGVDRRSPKHGAFGTDRYAFQGELSFAGRRSGSSIPSNPNHNHMTTNSEYPPLHNRQSWDDSVLNGFERLGYNEGLPIASSVLLSAALWTNPDISPSWLSSADVETAVERSLERLRKAGKVELAQRSLWKLPPKWEKS